MTFNDYESLLNEFLKDTYSKYISMSLQCDNFFDLDGRSYYRGKADMCMELIGWLIGSSLIIEIYKDKELHNDFINMLNDLGKRKEIE